MGVITLLSVGLFYGRALQRLFPAIDRLLPLAALFIILTLTLLSIRAYSYLRGRSKFQSNILNQAQVRSNRQHSLITGGILVISIALANSLVDLPIERIHLMKYAALSFFLFYSRRSPKLQVSHLLPPCCGAALFGVLEENLQRFVPERFYDPRDMALNALGALLGILLVIVFHRWFQQDEIIFGEPTKTDSR